MRDGGGRVIAWRRQERKFLVTEFQAEAVRRFCRSVLAPDEFAARRGGVYPVCSIYFDSPRLDLLRHALEKRVHRYKLRVRTYRSWREPPDPDAPVFLEIKKKDAGISNKLRAAAHGTWLEQLVAAQPDQWTALARFEPAHAANVTEFLLLSSTLRSRPALGACYLREAYESGGADGVRITLDRDLHYCVLGPPGTGTRAAWWPALAGPREILELKFTQSCPFWLADLLRRAEITPRGTSKYLLCARRGGVQAGEDRFLRVS